MKWRDSKAASSGRKVKDFSCPLLSIEPVCYDSLSN
jgi:hypothetical protein